jgi:dephospho-CoA kinase
VKVIGITGNFGTGKSFAASVFKATGAQVIDADSVAHEVIKKGRPEYRKVVEIFGKGVLDKNRDIDRKELAGIVFSDKKKLKILNSVIHPAVIKYIRRRIGQAKGCGIMVIDAPLLIEAGLANIADSLVVVKCPEKEQIKRAMNKFKIKKGEVLQRIRNQMSMSKKIELADFVIDNSGTKAETKKQVLRIAVKLETRKQ